jgi:hypothetical protein
MVAKVVVLHIEEPGTGRSLFAQIRATVGRGGGGVVWWGGGVVLCQGGGAQHHVSWHPGFQGSGRLYGPMPLRTCFFWGREGSGVVIWALVGSSLECIACTRQSQYCSSASRPHLAGCAAVCVQRSGVQDGRCTKRLAGMLTISLAVFCRCCYQHRRRQVLQKQRAWPYAGGHFQAQAGFRRKEELCINSALYSPCIAASAGPAGKLFDVGAELSIRGCSIAAARCRYRR